MTVNFYVFTFLCFYVLPLLATNNVSSLRGEKKKLDTLDNIVYNIGRRLRNGTE